MPLTFTREDRLDVQEYTALLEASTLAERRPVEDAGRMETMLAHSNLIVTARHEGRLVGAARAVTDFALCCYISDLAVDQSMQGQGIGQRLMREIRSHVHPEARVLLISAPKAVSFYEHIGLERLPQVFNVPAFDS